MAKKMVKRRKLRVFRLLLILLVMFLFFYGAYLFVNVPIKNIIIKNTNYLNDDYILELANIKNYPSFFLTRSRSIEKKLLDSPYIIDSDVKRKFFNVFEIKIVENKALYLDSTTNSVVFKNSLRVPSTDLLTVFRVPRLLNYVPDEKLEKFIKKMDSINEDVLGKVSDIEYRPNEFDKDRFLFYMDDGNMVYLTLTKFNQINYYNDVLGQLEGRKGILYLDSGNHFQIKE